MTNSAIEKTQGRNKNTRRTKKRRRKDLTPVHLKNTINTKIDTTGQTLQKDQDTNQKRIEDNKKAIQGDF